MTFYYQFNVYPLQTLIDLLTVKADVPTIERLLISNTLKTRVRQLAIELRAHVASTGTSDYIRMLNLLKAFWEANFRIVHFERKVAGDCNAKNHRTDVSDFPNCFVLYMVGKYSNLKVAKSVSNIICIRYLTCLTSKSFHHDQTHSMN